MDSLPNMPVLLMQYGCDMGLLTLLWHWQEGCELFVAYADFLHTLHCRKGIQTRAGND